LVLAKVFNQQSHTSSSPECLAHHDGDNSKGNYWSTLTP